MTLGFLRPIPSEQPTTGLTGRQKNNPDHGHTGVEEWKIVRVLPTIEPAIYTSDPP